MAFFFNISNSSGVPFYRQIVNQVVYGVANGVLKPGERLPTVRQLAVDLQVNLNTIVKAYNELEIRGVVNTQQGTGTFIAENQEPVDPVEQEKGLERLCANFLNEVAALGVKTEKVFPILKKIEKERTSHKGIHA
ncbi:MAG: GntR family transcriptional regulator [Chitinispirillaceae bacterium]|nr:GntR family transcriptional regulator [Chitinispirillaceae bacterium]